jgi:hypothetical protein
MGDGVDHGRPDWRMVLDAARTSLTRE